MVSARRFFAVLFLLPGTVSTIHAGLRAQGIAPQTTVAAPVTVAAGAGRPAASTPANTARQQQATTGGSPASSAVTACSLAHISVQPAKLLPGKSYTLILKAPDGTCDSSKLWDDIKVDSDAPGDISVGAVTAFDSDSRQHAVAITVAADPDEEAHNLLLRNKDGKIAAALPLRIAITKGPGPIPPGMPPALDIMWKVLPRDSVADSYGSRVADKYFAIEAVLGNQTQYDLQIAALGFKTPHVYCSDKAATAEQKKDPAWDECSDKLTNSSEKQSALLSERLPEEPPVPVDAYPIVRGTIVREQSVGTRTLVVNLVKGASSVLVGVGGFFADSGTFVRAVGISAGPFEKAIELIYPDLSTQHLLDLDSHALRDGAVLPNNQSVRINAFISRDLVQCPPPMQWYRLGVRSPRSYTCLNGDARIPWSRAFDPSEVAARLGQLTLIGRQIEYLGRVRVLNKSTEDSQSKPGPVVPYQNLMVKQGSNPATLTIVGSNLQGATVSVAVGEGITIGSDPPAVSAAGNSVTFKVMVADNASMSDAAMLQIATPSGTALTPIRVTSK